MPDPIPSNHIPCEAYELTVETLKDQGYTPSDYIYIEVENTLHDAKQSGKYMIAVGWPDKTYCFFASETPLLFSEIFPSQFIAAYYNSQSNTKLIYDLG